MDSSALAVEYQISKMSKHLIGHAWKVHACVVACLCICVLVSANSNVSIDHTLVQALSICKLLTPMQVLGALSFELTVPTAKTFLRRFLKAALPGDMPADARLEYLSSYLAELMLPEYRALQFLPSQVRWCLSCTTNIHRYVLALPF